MATGKISEIERLEEQAGFAVVNVVIPLFNGGYTIRRAIDSVLMQTFTDYRVLVVDDGSSDEGPNLVSAYNDSRVSLIRHRVNLGASAARNTGIAHSFGKYVAFLDADDSWRPEKLARQVAFMDERGEDLGACFCDFMFHREVEEVRTPRARKEWFDSFLDGCVVSPGSTMIVRRSVYDHIGDYDVAFERLEDWDWLLRCLDLFNVSTFPEVLADIYVQGTPSFDKVERSAERMLEHHLDRVREKRGAGGVARFRSSLELEKMVARVRGGRYPLAAISMLKSVVSSPTRFVDFLSRRLLTARSTSTDTY